MARPRIFLSHSSSQCAAQGCVCRAYLLALEEELRERGCEPVVDRNLLTIGLWNPQVLKEMKTCHGLIVLLSPHALGSDYILQELTVALYEEASNPHFLLLPVLLPGVRRRHLPKSKLHKLDLGRYDMVDWPPAPAGTEAAAGAGSPPESEAAPEPAPKDEDEAATGPRTGPAGVPEKIFSRLLPLVEHLGAVPHPEVTDFVAGRMTDVSDLALARTAEILGLATLAYATDHTRHIVAQGLLTERPVQELGDPCVVRSAFQHFLPQVKAAEHRADIVDLVVPFARIPGPDAELLRRVALGDGDRIALLRSTLGETPGLFVHRASETPVSWAVRKAVPRLDGTAFADGLVAGIRELLHEELAMGEPCAPETLARLLTRHETESGGPFTVVLHLPPDPSLVRLLLTEFPRLLFLFAHEQIAPRNGTGAPATLQGLTAGQEWDMVETYRKFRS
ncbi:TIR domain-containing protein [Streptomyces sp. NPDC000594]|uniref:TIR domain-containing protein n=1 Tax=Streptomyces sp. NPDC000594 TaxID=3154261 RepID=UPI00331877C5